MLVPYDHPGAVNLVEIGILETGLQAAQDAGSSWLSIGMMQGVSRQMAQHRYGKKEAQRA